MRQKLQTELWTVHGDVFSGGLPQGELKVLVDDDTVWLTQKQMAELYGCNRTVVTKHVKNIFKSGELDEKATSAKFALVQKEGNRDISRDVAYYNLDMIISVGYRVNSKRGIEFRRWATQMLKEKLRERMRPLAGVRRLLSCAERNQPISRSHSAATCARCLFGRLVHDRETGITMVECHASKPVPPQSFPLVRPDDFCSSHVSIRNRKRTYGGLVPELPLGTP